MSRQSPTTEFAKTLAGPWRGVARGATHLSWQSLIPVAFVLCWASGFVVVCPVMPRWQEKHCS